MVDILDDIREVCDIIKEKDFPYHFNSLGSLGGGNHFIELNCNVKTEDSPIYITIHTGSRNFGLKIAKYFQKKAVKYVREVVNKQVKKEIEQIKEKYKGKEIEKRVKELRQKYKLDDNLCYLSPEDKDKYIYCMKIAQKYANINRRLILLKILEYLEIDYNEDNIIESVHNYIDFEDNIIRKGAIRAHKGETVVIPMNMAYGIIIGKGRGNRDWNFSAPHGAGRVLGRGEAKRQLNMEEFKNSMKHIFSTSVNESTLDESPMAYKDPNIIIDYLGETIKITDTFKSIYNIKA